MPVKMRLKLPGDGGFVGPITAVHGLPVAGLLMFKVQVSWTPGVVSVAVTVKIALLVRYTAPVMAMKSATGFTVTATFALAERFEAELVALTLNESVFGADPAGTVGARKVCCAPFVPATGVSTTPAGATHV
jgi:hypothetical protein